MTHPTSLLEVAVGKVPEDHQDVQDLSQEDANDHTEQEGKPMDPVRVQIEVLLTEQGVEGSLRSE